MTDRRVLLGCSASFLSAFDFGLLILVAPSIDRTLHLRAAYPWLFGTSSFAFGTTLVVAGAAVDVLGAVRALRAGLGLFSAGCAVAATAGGAPSILAGRALAGVGAALAAPAALSLLTSDALAERASAMRFSAWGAAVPAGFVSGALIGAVATSLAGWRASLIATAVLGLAGLACASASRAGERPSVPSAAALGYDGPWAVGALGVAALAVDVRVGVPIAIGGLLLLRRAGPESPFRAAVPALAGCVVGAVTMATGVGATCVLVTQLQRAGSSLLVCAAALTAFAAGVPLARRLTPRRAGAPGLALQAAGIMALVPFVRGSVLGLVPGLALFGVGHAVANAGAARTVMQASLPWARARSGAVLGIAQYAGGAAGPVILLDGMGDTGAGLIAAAALAATGATVAAALSGARGLPRHLERHRGAKVRHFRGGRVNDPITTCPDHIGARAGAADRAKSGLPTTDVAEPFFATRTLEAIEMLTFTPSSAPQVARVLRVDARTARRLLNRLAEAGWLTRGEAPHRIYSPTLRLVALAAHLANRAPLGYAAREAITALHEQTGATAHLAVPSYRSVLCLVHRAGGPDARPQLRELLPAHASAGGKVLLAYRDAWRESVLELPLERITERTVVNAELVRAECREVRAAGVAVEREEYRPGLYGIAAPIRDRSGDVPAAVVLSGADAGLAGEHVAAVVAAARGIATQLGANLP